MQAVYIYKNQHGKMTQTSNAESREQNTNKKEIIEPVQLQIAT